MEPNGKIADLRGKKAGPAANFIELLEQLLDVKTKPVLMAKS